MASSGRQSDPYAEWMDDYTAEADKFFTEVDHLDRVLDGDNLHLSLSVAKRCRNRCNDLVRALARHRDQLQPEQEGTSE